MTVKFHLPASLRHFLLFILFCAAAAVSLMGCTQMQSLCTEQYRSEFNPEADFAPYDDYDDYYYETMGY